MKKKTIYMIVGALLLIAAGAGAIGFYLFNKGPLDVKHSKAIEVSAVDLYHLFNIDSSLAKKSYTGKVLLVTGEVNDISTSTENLKIITLKTNVPGAAINCTLEGVTERSAITGIVHVKGICSGIGDGDPDLGLKGDVYLSRCFLVN